MSEYQPGMVAIATVRSVKGVRIFRVGNLWAADETSGLKTFFHDDEDVTDVRPLVVLDLDGMPDNGYATEAKTAIQTLRDVAEIGGRNEAAVLRFIADQIEAQTKPARIPEPGLWGVVEAHTEDGPGRRRFVRHDGDDNNGGRDWQRQGVRRAWDDLIDPVLVREGVES